MMKPELHSFISFGKPPFHISFRDFPENALLLAPTGHTYTNKSRKDYQALIISVFPTFYDKKR